MNARAALLDQWRTALVFSIGVDDLYDISRLPDVRKLPLRFPIEPGLASKSGYHYDHSCACDYLGAVLGIAALKMLRGYGDDPLGEGVDVCGDGLSEVRKSLRILQERFGDSDLSDSYSAALGAVLDFALCAPLRLPVVCARLDALSNDELHRMAMEAIQGRQYPCLLEDLFKPAEVAE